MIIHDNPVELGVSPKFVQTNPHCSVKDAELRVTADAEGQVFVRDVVQTGIFHDIWIDERHLFWGDN